MLTGMGDLSMPDFVDIDRVGEHLIKGAAPKATAARTDAGLGNSNLGDQAAAVEFCPDQADRAELQKELIDEPHSCCFPLVDDQPPLVDVVPQRSSAAHP